MAVRDLTKSFRHCRDNFNKEKVTIISNRLSHLIKDNSFKGDFIISGQCQQCHSKVFMKTIYTCNSCQKTGLCAQCVMVTPLIQLGISSSRYLCKNSCYPLLYHYNIAQTFKRKCINHPIHMGYLEIIKSLETLESRFKEYQSIIAPITRTIYTSSMCEYGQESHPIFLQIFKNIKDKISTWTTLWPSNPSHIKCLQKIKHSIQLRVKPIIKSIQYYTKIVHDITISARTKILQDFCTLYRQLSGMELFWSEYGIFFRDTLKVLCLENKIRVSIDHPQRYEYLKHKLPVSLNREIISILNDMSDHLSTRLGNKDIKESKDILHALTEELKKNNQV